jgi:hypothetical protein
MELLQDEGRVVIAELSQTFAVSEMTVHRDLDRLAAHGRLRKVRGGAVPVAETGPNAARCLVCYKQPRRQMQVLFQGGDGRSWRACCPHCAVMGLGQLSDPPTGLLVTDFLYGRALPARIASFLIAPEITICCTPTVLAFEREDHARRFRRGFGGEVVDWATVCRRLRRACACEPEETA